MVSLDTTVYSNPNDNTDYYVVYHKGGDPIFLDNHMRNKPYPLGRIDDIKLIVEILHLDEYTP